MIALHELLAASASDAGACVARDGTAVIGFGTFHARTLRLASQLHAIEGQRVALSIGDPYTFASALFALFACAKEPVIPANATPGHLADLRDGFDVLLTDADVAAMEAGAAAQCARSCTIAPDAPLTLYTSGSSGAPKPVRKTLAQFDAEVRTLEAQWGDLVGDATILASVPHHHIYGMLFRIFWPLAAGRAFDRATCTDPQQLQARMADCRGVVVVSTPAQLSRWPDLPGFASLGAARAFFSSGGPLGADTAERFAATLGNAPFEIYGSTETGGIAWRMQTRSAAWQPMPGIEVRRAADGALEVRSPHLGREGWHCTDDAVQFDESGRFRLQGRLDRVIKVEGKRISLAEIEQRLREHAFVAEAAATTLEGATRRRIGALVVLSAAGSAALREERRTQVVKALRRHLGAYFDLVALPRHWRFREALPFDERGKLPAAAIARAFEPHSAGFELLAEAFDGSQRFYEVRVPRTLVHFEGHFPGLPILPGVLKVDWAMRLASEYVPAVRAIASVDQVKFMAPVPPGAVLTLALTHDAARRRVAFTYRLGERDCASGTFVYREGA